MRPPSAAIAASLLAAGLVASSGVAQPRQAFTIEWTAPDECPSADSVSAGIHDLLGPSPDASRPIAARATAYRGEDAQWHVEIITTSQDGTGQRKVSGPSCKAVAEAAELIVALAVDPDAVAARSGLLPASASVSVAPPPASALPAPASAPSAPPAAPPPSRPAASSRPAPGVSFTGRAALSVRAVADIGALPSATPGWSAAIAYAPEGWRFGVSAQDFASRRQTLSQRPGAGGEFDLWTAGLLACRELAGSSLSAWVCAGAEVGKLHARGYGVRAPSSSNPWWYAATVDAAGQWKLGEAIAVRCSAGIAVPLDRKWYVIDPYGSVHRASPVSARFTVGPTLFFP
jgi:hypothetical protein